MALNFSGGSSTDRVSRTATIAVPTQRTYLVWFKATGAFDVTTRRLWDFHDGASNGVDLLAISSTRLEFQVVWSSTIGRWEVTSLPSTGVWHSLILAYDDGGTVNDPVIYIDGVSQTVNEFSTPAGSAPSTATELHIGNSAGTDRAWNGDLARFARWDTILTAAEIEALAAGYPPHMIRSGSLFLWYELEENQASAVPDFSGNGRHANAVAGLLSALNPPFMPIYQAPPSASDFATSSGTFTLDRTFDYADGQTGHVVTLTGSGTSWLTSTPVFSVSGPTGVSKTAQSIISDTSATVTITYGTTAGAVTITDPVSSHQEQFTLYVPVDNANWFWSPYNWYEVSNVRRTTAPGAYCRFRFTGSTCKLKYDTSLMQTLGTDADKMPKVAHSLDNGDWVVTQLTKSASVQDLTIASTGSGTREVELIFINFEPYQSPVANIWTPDYAVVFTGMELADGEDLAAFTPRPNNMVVYGDSIVQGVFSQSLNTGNHTVGDDARDSLPRRLGQAFDAEVGALGYGSQGYGKTGLSSIPRVYHVSGGAYQASTSTWDKHHSEASRLSGGLFSPAPDFIVMYHGTADDTGSSSDADVTNSIHTSASVGMIQALRAAAPNAEIFVCIPAGQRKASAITAGFNAFQTASPDSKVYLIDLGTGEPALGLTSGSAANRRSFDGVHYKADTYADVSVRETQAMQASRASGEAVFQGVEQMGRDFYHGDTNVSTIIRILDATNGDPEQSVEHNTAGLSLWYRREGETLQAITPVALASASAAHADGGIEHLDDGYYRLDLPDAAVAAGATGVQVGGTVPDMLVISSYHALREPGLRLLGRATIESSVQASPVPSTTVFAGATALEGVAQDFYNNRYLVFTSGRLKGIGRFITDYDPASRLFDFTNHSFPEPPAVGDAFLITGGRT